MIFLTNILAKKDEKKNRKNEYNNKLCTHMIWTQNLQKEEGMAWPLQQILIDIKSKERIVFNSVCQDATAIRVVGTILKHTAIAFGGSKIG
jgi:hypothetical protein